MLNSNILMFFAYDQNSEIHLIALCCYFQGLPGEMGADGPVGPPGPQVSIYVI